MLQYILDDVIIVHDNVALPLQQLPLRPHLQQGTGVRQGGFIPA